MAVPFRPVVEGVFRFVLVGLLTSVLLIGTTLLICFIISCIWGGDSSNPQLLGLATVCALIAWLFIAVFHLRPETQSMAFSQREQFVAKAKVSLSEMGYVLAGQTADTLTFQPGFRSYLFGSGIHISLLDQEAKLTGPKVALELFRRCFRMLNHVQRVQLYLQEQRKVTENVIKRVELHFRVGPEKFDIVRKNIIEVLEKEARVICEMNLLVQSDEGIRERQLEAHVRDWLERLDISMSVHKDVVQFVEVVPERETESANA